MLEDNPREIEELRKEWDELSKRYDGYFTTFDEKIDQYLKWVMKIYGNFVYSLPEEMRKATSWEKRLYAQVSDIIDRFSKEPSITGMGSELILVGEKI